MKKLYAVAPERWSNREDMYVVYELEFKGSIIKPGTKFKIKNERTTFTFTCLVTNTRLNSTWVECMTPEGFRSIRPEKITSIVGIKRSRAKKQ